MNANEWNSKYPIGTGVKYWPPGRNDYVATETLSEAWMHPREPEAVVRIGAAKGWVSTSNLIPEEEK